MAIEVKASEAHKRKQAMKKDQLIMLLKEATDEQIELYIDNNINDLESAKMFLKKFARICVYILKKVEP